VTDVFNRSAVHMRLNVLPKIIVAWTGHPQAHAHASRDGDGFEWTFARDEAAQEAEIILRVRPEGKLRRIDSVVDNRHGGELRNATPLILRNRRHTSIRKK